MIEFIDADDVHRMLDFETLVSALEEAHKGDTPRHDRHLMEEPRGDDQPDIFINLPAWQPGEGIGVKLVTSFPRNKKEHGIPTVNAVYVWIDGVTGVAQAVMDGEALIFRKTAADSALGAKLLARPDVQTILMIGAGALAPYLVEAHRTVRPSLDRVLIWNRTRSNGEALAARLKRDGVDATVIDDLRAGLREADLVSAATMTPSPLVYGEELKPGSHVDLVGSFTPQMRESDDETLRRATIFVDSYGTTERSGDFLDPVARGIISIDDDVVGDLYGLCRGTISGRTAETEITLMKNGGGSHLDYFTAREVMTRWKSES